MAIIAVSLIIVGLLATVIVFTDDPSRQAVTLSCLGLALTILFMTLEAPDVALSQVAVGSAVVPQMVLLAIRKVRQVRAGADSHSAARPAGAQSTAKDRSRTSGGDR